ncbi:hypothetical protein KAU87_04760 [Candidatus Bathyarchaeota archaeon]|nr:hypothetical protein [Candidatus Bathyarchaeota archaeon]
MGLRRIGRRRDKAVSPAISTVIVTGMIVGLVTIALSFAGNFLVLRIAESEFNSAKQFMQTFALQIDNVAWSIGRTETARYSSRYGDVAFETALTYTIYVNTTSQSNVKFYTSTTGILCFNMPITYYSVGDNYFDLLYPSFNSGFLLDGASAPNAKVFVVEKLSMTDGSFLRVVVMPSVRMVNLTIGDTNYVRLYLPILSVGETPKRSQSVTMTGDSISKLGKSITALKVEVNFPEADFDNSFFHFPQSAEQVSFTTETVLELYVGEVDVGLGVHA